MGETNGVSLRLKKFNLDEMNPLAVILAIGKRRSGKSFLLRDLLSRHQAIPTGLVMSATEMANKFFGDFVPGCFIHEGFVEKTLDSYIQSHKALTEKMKHEQEVMGKSDIDPKNFFIMDDLGYDAPKWVKNKDIKFLFMNGRHIHTLFLLTLQYPKGIPPALRTNVDYTFIFREPNMNNRKILYDNYAGMFATFDDFCQVMNQCTNNFECLVIDNTSSSNSLTDQVFWYKAAPQPDFKMCKPAYWKISAQLNKPTKPGEELYDLDKIRKSKNPRINVVKTY
jgi:hypothetical protein